MAEAALNIHAADNASSLGATVSNPNLSDLIGAVTMLEEHVDSGLDDLLKSYAPKLNLASRPIDAIPEQFSISLAHPLPELDTSCAKAYAASHLQKPNVPIYALVLDPKTPYRQRALEALSGVIHPNSVSLHGFGKILLSSLNEERMVLFVSRPTGKRLSDLLKEGVTFSERQVISTVLRPVCDALAAMAEKGIAHGKINPANIFIGDITQIGECLSEPSGLSQDMLYEPLERAQCSPIGKGPAVQKTDSYALAILAYELLYGLEKYRSASSKDFIAALLEKGSYHLFSNVEQTSEYWTDFFRGTLTENKEERWGLEQISQWLSGKRFNLIYPSLPTESSRPFLMHGKEYFSRRALAHGIFTHWADSLKELKDSRLDRWIEMSVHKSDVAEQIERILSSGMRSEKGLNEMCARIVIALHPYGAIRMRDISFNTDGMGYALAHYLSHGHQAEMNLMVSAIEADLPNFWAGQTDLPKTETTTFILWKMQKVRRFIKMNHLGFGVERALYDFNAKMPCQSKMLLPYHVTTKEEALFVLDALAAKLGSTESLLDRHLAAFVASQIDLPKEVVFSQLPAGSALKNNLELQVLYILAQAQLKGEKPQLYGLSAWVAKRVESLLDHIQNRPLRKKLKLELKGAANSGYLANVLNIVLENPLSKEDSMAFRRANVLFQHNLGRIESLKNEKVIDKVSQEIGGRIAILISYFALIVTAYVMLDQYYM